VKADRYENTRKVQKPSEPPHTKVFSVKIVDNQFVVENEDDSGITVEEGTRQYYNACLKTFERALAYVNERKYNKDIISQLLLSSTRLTLCIPNRRIEELELSLAPIRHQLAAFQYISGMGTDKPSQHATTNVLGEFRALLYLSIQLK